MTQYRSARDALALKISDLGPLEVVRVTLTWSKTQPRQARLALSSKHITKYQDKAKPITPAIVGHGGESHAELLRVLADVLELADQYRG